jgi:hypothetical protein
MLPLAALVFAAAVLIGALLAHVVSSMPLAIHACAEQHGRYVLLGSAAEGARPSAGRRASPRLPVRTIAPDYGFAPPGLLRPTSAARRAAYATLNGAQAIAGPA